MGYNTGDRKLLFPGNPLKIKLEDIITMIKIIAAKKAVFLENNRSFRIFIIP
jgi:hypothetical protein